MAISADEPAADASKRHSRRLIYYICGALAVALLAGATALLVMRDRPDEYAAVPPQFSAGLAVAEDTPVSLGSVLIDNPDARDIEVLDVAVNVSSNVDVLGVLAITPREQAEHGYYYGGPGFPPLDEVPITRPAVGTRINGQEFDVDDIELPGEPGLQLMIGIQVQNGDIGGLNGVTVTYRLGRTEHTDHIPHAILICVKPSWCDFIDDVNDPRALDEEEQLRRLGLL